MNRALRIGLFCAFVLTGAAFVLLGIFSGQAQAVLSKEMRVCLECIGFG